MFTLGFATTILIILSTSLTHSFDYCTLSCPGSQHTMCTFPQGGSSKCSEYRKGLMAGEYDLILDLHNEMRQKVANGQEQRGPQPPSSNMMQMKWDQEAEVIAQRWADQCEYEGHDLCRKSMTGQEIGQNIAWQWQYSTRSKITRVEVIKKMMWDFYNEVSRLRGSVDSYTFDSDTGHYTQIVWAETTGVGCGFTELTRGYETEFKMVCNYSPAGDWIGVRMYRVGAPCSECPVGTSCSPEWPGLCN